MKDNLRYSYFLKEQRNIKNNTSKNYIDEEEAYLKSLLKEFLPLMSIKDLVGCLIVKTCDDEGAILKGIPYGDAEYEVQIKKIQKEN